MQDVIQLAVWPGASRFGRAKQRDDRLVQRCGHVHRPIQRRWAGTVVLTAPSTAHQVDLNLHPGTPSGFIMEPPACLLHVWSEALGLVTHTSYIGDYGGAQPYRMPSPA